MYKKCLRTSGAALSFSVAEVLPAHAISPSTASPSLWQQLIDMEWLHMADEPQICTFHKVSLKRNGRRLARVTKQPSDSECLFITHFKVDSATYSGDHFVSEHRCCANIWVLGVYAVLMGREEVGYFTLRASSYSISHFIKNPTEHSLGITLICSHQKQTKLIWNKRNH